MIKIKKITEDTFTEDMFKEDHTCKFCGCLMEHEHQEGMIFYLGKKDYACELCRLEYQDALEE